MALLVLVFATVIIAIAQIVQIAQVVTTKHSTGISLGSEAINSLAAGGLLVYAIHLTDLPLVVSRISLFVLWAARLVVAWRYR